MSDIKVTKTCNPTPNRNWDYQAVRGDYDLGALVGDGPTPEAAIADLIEQEESR